MHRRRQGPPWALLAPLCGSFLVPLGLSCLLAAPVWAPLLGPGSVHKTVKLDPGLGGDFCKDPVGGAPSHRNLAGSSSMSRRLSYLFRALAQNRLIHKGTWVMASRAMRVPQVQVAQTQERFPWRTRGAAGFSGPPCGSREGLDCA